MKISELLKKISVNNLDLKNDFEVAGLAFDSRKVRENYIFFAIKGYKDDGNKFVQNAINNGAKLIVTSEKNMESDNVNYFYSENVRRSMAEMSSAFYDFPSEKLNLIGITGTNGKTTTSYLIKSIIEENNFKSGLIGTIDYISNNTKEEASLTTPESIELNRMLSEMVNSGFKYCVMEVSSVSLVLDRVYGLKFKSAVFTNLTPEHLDFHNSMDEYFKSKKILFDNLPASSIAVTNLDDEYGDKIISDTKAKIQYYSINKNSDFKATNIKINTNGISFTSTVSGKEFKFETGITGRFNIYNSLAAITVCIGLGFELNSISSALKKFNYVDGRFNIIPLKNGADAIIDYSHTSDSLKNAIEAAIDLINERGEKGRVITIFGCGGNKDKIKRPVMGKIATELSDYVIITSDNPRFEEPMEIINEILNGVEDKTNFEIEVNRELAIKRGLEISEKGDLILICGKGHETYQEINGVKNHFDDKEIVKKYNS
ncbi:MAG TPA: UDP-N-acetylmuramoyl-L-alanyl-D-glutamate--2,6-diaminopimelate ligase [Ignavibacteria bacterium]|nr:UDP-N-acetylmuramoyl-L-alanyl-D-glutamate--2,6-diaminopimelate ligase [Ignavibacteria bacterium]